MTETSMPQKNIQKEGLIDLIDEIFVNLRNWGG
jgi:hypothetical protein